MEHSPEYRVGYRRPPLDTRFQKGQSGNPEGGRRHRPREKRLAVLLESALDARMAHPRRPLTRREAIVAALVEKSAAGDLRAVKLLLELVAQAELSRGPDRSEEAESARERFIQELDRLAAEQERAAAEAQATHDELACG